VLEKAGKLKRVPFADRDAMKKLVDPVMAAYAKEIGADAIFSKITAVNSPLSSGVLGAALGLPGASPLYCIPMSWFKSPGAVQPGPAALLVVSVGILIIPVTLQIFSRYTALIPPTSGPRRWRASCSSG
jgi:hypothetical protein